MSLHNFLPFVSLNNIRLLAILPSYCNVVHLHKLLRLVTQRLHLFYFLSRCPVSFKLSKTVIYCVSEIPVFSSDSNYRYPFCFYFHMPHPMVFSVHCCRTTFLLPLHLWGKWPSFIAIYDDFSVLFSLFLGKF